MRILIIIPAFNEEDSLQGVISDLRSNISSAEILVINDGSTDNTAQVARNCGVKVLSIPFNIGVGGALKVGFRYALENKFDSVVQVDGDGQHLASEIQKLVSVAEKNCVVVGSRFSASTKGYEIGLARRIAIRILAVVTSKICRTRLTDVSSGFRLSTGHVIDLFAKEYPRDYLGDTVESLVLATRNGFKVKEVPVKMLQREFGTPSQNLIKSVWHLIRTLLVLILMLFKKSKSEI